MRLCHKMGIYETSDLGRYLGFPLLQQGRNGNAFNFVAEKIQAKLAGWKSRLLSRAGRLMLIKATAAPIANYYMQCHALPIRKCVISYGAPLMRRKRCTWLIGKLLRSQRS